MPTPLDILLDPATLTVIGIYLGLIAWEVIAPARALPRIPGWRFKAALAFLAYVMISSYLPLVWDAHLAPFQLFDLTSLGTWGGAAVGLAVYELGVYWWHRTMHRRTPLWRVFHQMHHSAERIDASGAFWFSPFDMAGWTLLTSLSLVLIVGLTPEATKVVLLSTSFLSIFQHANLRTPRWLGYLVQRPESHAQHHARGMHANNYSDLPVFDLLFGTFENPERHAAQAGFWNGASSRVLDMLRFRDVSNPPQVEVRANVAIAGDD